MANANVIDISHHNNISDFANVRKAGIGAVIHKATQGIGYTDPTLKANRRKIKNAGLQFGAYHFGTAGNATAQADYFLSTVGNDPALLVLDFEPNSQGHDMSLLEAEEFVHHIAQTTGKYPGLYSGHTIKEALAKAAITSAAQTELSKCWLWIAQYGPAPLIPKVWDRWTLWQYTDGAAGSAGPLQIPGVGRCDRDQFNGTSAELAAFWASQLTGVKD
jgi:lysozyme